jgi:hypothetical protein
MLHRSVECSMLPPCIPFFQDFILHDKHQIVLIKDCLRPDILKKDAFPIWEQGSHAHYLQNYFYPRSYLSGAVSGRHWGLLLQIYIDSRPRPRPHGNMAGAALVVLYHGDSAHTVSHGLGPCFLSFSHQQRHGEIK